jgi:Holliday junction resolvase
VILVKSKQKGSAFERDLVKELNIKLKYLEREFKRIPGSGAIGTVLNEPLLTADVSGKIKGFPKKIKIECKVGYGGATQLTLKRDWLNKIKEEAKTDWSFPILIGKFSGARSSDGVQKFAVMDLEDLIYLFNFLSALHAELELSYEKKK